jgi:hypothetical protein
MAGPVADSGDVDGRVYYSTPFGDTNDVRRQVFLLQRDRVPYVPVFRSVESMQRFYTRVNRRRTWSSRAAWSPCWRPTARSSNLGTRRGDRAAERGLGRYLAGRLKSKWFKDTPRDVSGSTCHTVARWPPDAPGYRRRAGHDPTESASRSGQVVGADSDES